MLGVRGLGPRFLSKPREQLLLLLVQVEKLNHATGSMFGIVERLIGTF